jgi:hypothetical protein
LGLGVDNPFRVFFFFSLRVNECFLRVNGRHFCNSVVISYSMIPRCRPNSTFFLFHCHIYSACFKRRSGTSTSLAPAATSGADVERWRRGKKPSRFASREKSWFLRQYGRRNNKGGAGWSRFSSRATMENSRACDSLSSRRGTSDRGLPLATLFFLRGAQRRRQTIPRRLVNTM